jgi:hypothetical protein
VAGVNGLKHVPASGVRNDMKSPWSAWLEKPFMTTTSARSW